MEPGKRKAIVLEHCLTESEQKKTPAVTVLFKVQGLPNGERDTILGYIWLTEKADHLARKSLKAIGFDPESQNISDLNDNEKLLAGHECQLDIQLDENGFPYVQWINGPDGDLKNLKMDTDKAKTIGAKFDGIIRAAKFKPKSKKAKLFDDPADNPGF